jgi:hypothetical protein
VGEVRWSAAKVADVQLVCSEGMLYPGLADLLEALVISRPATHSIKVVWNNRVIGVRQCKKIHRHIPGVTRGCAHPQADLGSTAPKLNQTPRCADIAGDDIRPWV